MNMWPRSLRWRLQLWYGALLAAVLAGFAVTAYALAREHHLRRIDEDLDRRAAALLPALRAPPRERPVGPRFASPPSADPPTNLAVRRPAPPEEHPVHFDRPGPPRLRPDPVGPPPIPPLEAIETAVFPNTGRETAYFLIANSSGTVLRASSSAPSLSGDRVVLPDVDRAIRQRGELREHVRRLRPGLVLIVGRPIRSDLAELRRFGAGLAAAAALVWGASMAVGAYIARRAIRPIETIATTAMRIAGGDLGSRIALHETDSELGALARVLNETFDRLCEALARQTRFTADASHELRTPLAVILSQAESTLARERSARDYREALEACLRAAKRLQHLVESLLTLARLDVGGGGPSGEIVALEHVVAEAVELLRPLALERRIEISASLQPAACTGRADELFQVALNLITNAIHYNYDGGRIEVSTRTEDSVVRLTVKDTGIGIAPEHLPRIFERFYRVDPARSRAGGRAGLGLSIASEVVRRHGGRIEVTSEPTRGSEFVVTLPGVVA